MVLRSRGAKSKAKKLRNGASAADGGRPRYDYVIDDINRSKISPNPAPEQRRSNRAFPRNHADLDRHLHGPLVLLRRNADVDKGPLWSII